MQADGLAIRPLGPGDAQAILEIYRQCADFLALGPQPQATLDMVLADLRHSVEEHGRFCGIFHPADRLVGVVDYVPGMYQGDPQRAFLSLLMIGRPYRSRGLGAAVVAALAGESLKDSQVVEIHSAVQVNNPRAIRFWERMGYRIIGGPQRNPDQTIVYLLSKRLRESNA